MHKKFEIIQTKINGGCQSGRKVVTHNSKSDLPPETLQHPDVEGVEEDDDYGSNNTCGRSIPNRFDDHCTVVVY